MREALIFGGAGLAGLAWLDYDGDGDLDLYATNGPTGNALFRNDGHGGFDEVAAEANAVVPGVAHIGVAAGDLDNDGFPDLIVLGDSLGPFAFDVTVLHNQGDGTFEDVSATSGLGGFPSSASGVLLDYDRDGLLDVFVAGVGTVGIPESAGLVDENGDPIVWDARMDSSRLYRNLGGLTFEETTVEAGIFKAVGSCAVAATDFNRDGWLDVVVSSCNRITEGPVGGNCEPGVPCPVCVDGDDPGPCRPEGSGGNPLPAPFNLWRNNGDGTFTDIAEDPATGLEGVGGFWMSVTPGDYNNDGHIDFFATNLGGRNGAPHALVRNNGDGTFSEVGAAAGVSDPDFGWGASFQDFDRDGDLDLFVSGNFPGISLGPNGNPGRLYVNHRGRFRLSHRDLGIDLANRYSTGVAAADYDNDGRVDLAVATETVVYDEEGMPLVPESTVLLRNRLGGHHRGWLTVRLVGTQSNRQGIGARLVLVDGGRRQVREVYAGSSIVSTESPWPTFGVRNHRANVAVRWPSGLAECFKRLRTRRTVELVEGEGRSYGSCF